MVPIYITNSQRDSNLSLRVPLTAVALFMYGATPIYLDTWGIMGPCVRLDDTQGWTGADLRTVFDWWKENRHVIQLITRYYIGEIARLDFDPNWDDGEIKRLADDPLVPTEIHKHAKRWLAGERMHREEGYPDCTDKSRYVYLLRNSEGLYKIGIATNPVRRAAEIGKASGFEVTLVASFLCKDARGQEQSYHQRFVALRKHGEWFSLSQAEVTQLLTEWETGR